MHHSLFDPRIKLRHVSCVIEVTRHGGVVAASNVLGMSQPAVSKSIAELEKILATKLFDRSGRKLQLTREGEIFAQYATGAAAALREGIESIDSARARRNTVRIGTMPSVESTLIPGAVATFLNGLHACNVQLESGSATHALNLLRDGQLDFCIGRLADPSLMAGLTFERILSDTVEFVVRPDHPLTRLKEVTFADLAQKTLILPPPSAVSRRIMDSLLVAGGIGKPKREIQTLSTEIGRNMTQNTDAVWAISHSVVTKDLQDATLVRLQLDTAHSQGPIGIVKRVDDKLSVACLAMIAVIREEVRNLKMTPEPR